MDNDRINDIYEDCMKRFQNIEDYDNRHCVEDIILSLKKIVKDNNPYFYDMLYLDKKYEKYVTKCTMQTRIDYDNFILTNRDYFSKILSNFTKFNVVDEVEQNICIEESNAIIKSFFKMLDIDLSKLFDLMKSNIFRVLPNGWGKTLYDPEKDMVYLLIGKEDDFQNMVTLVHEMGHGYRDYLFKKRGIIHDYEENLKSEIFSESLELSFIKYLINNDIYATEANNYLINFNNRIIKSANSLIRDNFIRDNGMSSISDFKYLIGRILGYYYLNSNMTLKELFVYINSHTIMEILNNIDYQEICKNFNNGHCLRK